MKQYICGSMFKWKNGFASAEASCVFGINRSPSSFLVKSPKTGIFLKFSVDPDEAIEAECWDGEFSIFRDENKKFAIQISNY